MAQADEVFATAETRCSRRDGALVLSLERSQAQPAITPDVLEGLQRGVLAAESEHAALVIISATKHFGFGANLDPAFDATAAGHPEVLDATLDHYQQVMLQLRHASIPTVAAVRGVAIAGACEILMHCTRVVAHPRSYIGLTEPMVGVVPGGGGLKELARRAAETDELPQLITRALETVSAGKVSANAAEAQQLGLLTPLDHVTAVDPLAEAIELGKCLLERGHRSPQRNPAFRVAGAQTRQQLYVQRAALLESGSVTPHQFEIDRRIASILCGGDGADEQRTEAELLALERQHFLALAQMPLSTARREHFRNTGQILIN